MSVFFFSYAQFLYNIKQNVSRKEIKGNEQKSPDTKIISWFETIEK